MKPARILAVIPATVIWATSVEAQPAEVNIEVSACIALESDLERYDCYERLTQGALKESAASPPGASTSPAIRGTAAASRSATPAPEEIRSSITALEERRPNEQVITLQNGQVWIQTVAKRYPLRVGQEVRIYATRWGDSYRLTANERNGFVQVERVQ